MLVDGRGCQRDLVLGQDLNDGPGIGRRDVARISAPEGFAVGGSLEKLIGLGVRV